MTKKYPFGGLVERDTLSSYIDAQEVPILVAFLAWHEVEKVWLLHRLHGGSGSVQSIINRVCIGLVVFAQDGGLSWVEVRLGRPICTHVAQFVRMSSKKGVMGGGEIK